MNIGTVNPLMNIGMVNLTLDKINKLCYNTNHQHSAMPRETAASGYSVLGQDYYPSGAKFPLDKIEGMW